MLASSAPSGRAASLDRLDAAAAALGNWRMPAETVPQTRVWMAFPPRGSAVTQTEADVTEARTAWSEVAHAIIDFEAVTMVVDPADIADARRMLSSEIEIVAAPLDDAWMRDIGPTFVLDPEGRVGAVDWTFNGWGQQEWAAWTRDTTVGRAVTRLAGSTPLSSALVNEGGAMVVDGQGTVLLTETVQLDPLRNPDMTREQVEAEIARTIGAAHAIWLPRGLFRDTQRFGTKGHADMMVAIPSPGRLLVHRQLNPSHPDHLITAELLRVLSESTDAAGRPWDIVEIPAPDTVRDAGGWVDCNYINHTAVNGGVIACQFADPQDDTALGLLRESYPGRSVVGVDARPIFARGGGIHCITLQEPQTNLPI